MSPPSHMAPAARKVAERCDTFLTVLGLVQIQSDEHVHLDLLGQTLDGHDLDLLRIGMFMQSSNPSEVQMHGTMRLRCNHLTHGNQMPWAIVQGRFCIGWISDTGIFTGQSCRISL